MPRLTFDNLGEAADIERGPHDSVTPVGDHPSVTVALPRLLHELDRLRLRATFFVEGWNAGVYPDVLRRIAAHGHEVGLHGWRHEAWAALDADAEEALLARACEALVGIGLTPRAFRPPGGEPTPRTAQLLAARHFSWWSPAAGTGAADGGPELVPFAWEHVDAFHRLDTFADRRGGPALDPEATADVLCAAPADATLVLHPFLMTDDAGCAAARRVLAHTARHAED